MDNNSTSSSQRPLFNKTKAKTTVPKSLLDLFAETPEDNDYTHDFSHQTVPPRPSIQSPHSATSHLQRNKTSRTSQSTKNHHDNESHNYSATAPNHAHQSLNSNRPRQQHQSKSTSFPPTHKTNGRNTGRVTPPSASIRTPSPRYHTTATSPISNNMDSQLVNRNKNRINTDSDTSHSIKANQNFETRIYYNNQQSQLDQPKSKFNTKPTKSQRRSSMTGISSSEFEKFIVETEVGRGAFGDVYRVKHIETGLVYAMKSIEIPFQSDTNSEYSGESNKKQSPEDMANSSWMKEVILMKQFSHPNVVKLFYYHIGETTINLLMELCEGGSLRDLYKSKGSIKESEAKGYMAQILHGLVYLHESNFIHSDIKASNILITKGIIKLADFGVSEHKVDADDSEDTKQANGSPYWMAPEVVQLKGVTPACDIWALGATLIEILTTKPPFYDHEPFSALHAIGSGTIPDFPKDISHNCSLFLASCLHVSPNDRKTAKQLLNEPWITGVSNVDLEDTGRILKETTKNNQSFFCSSTARVAIEQYSELPENVYDDDFENQPNVGVMQTIRTISKQQRLNYYRENNNLTSDEDNDDFFESDNLQNLKLCGSFSVDGRKEFVSHIAKNFEDASFEDLKTLDSYISCSDDIKDGEEQEEEDESVTSSLSKFRIYTTELLAENDFIPTLAARLETESSDNCKLELVKVALNVFEYDAPNLIQFCQIGSISNILNISRQYNTKLTLRFTTLLVTNQGLTPLFLRSGGYKILADLVLESDKSQQTKVTSLLISSFTDEETSNIVLSSVLVKYSIPRFLVILLVNVFMGTMPNSKSTLVKNIIKLISLIFTHSSEKKKLSILNSEFIYYVFKVFPDLLLSCKLEILKMISLDNKFMVATIQSWDSKTSGNVFEKMLTVLTSGNYTREMDKLARYSIPIMYHMCSQDENKQFEVLSTKCVALFNRLDNSLYDSGVKKTFGVRDQMITMFIEAAGNPTLKDTTKEFGGFGILLSFLVDPKYRLVALQKINLLLKEDANILDSHLKLNSKDYSLFTKSFRIDRDLDEFLDEMENLVYFYQCKQGDSTSNNILRHITSSGEIFESLFARLEKSDRDRLSILDFFKTLYKTTPLSVLQLDSRCNFERIRLQMKTNEIEGSKDEIRIIDEILDS